MKKIFCFALGFLALLSCQMYENTASRQSPSQASYSDWDRAVRIDVDMQNMYLNTPRRIDKPIDMYMAMALAVKYNYTRRMVSYEESLLKAGDSSFLQLQDILGKAGYINTNNSSQLAPDLKVAWNVLDMSMLYYQHSDPKLKANVAFEQSRKVIHNILQETRVLYWKTLTAQRLLPVIDDMTEYLMLEVDEMNAAAKELAKTGSSPSRDDLIKKRKYMEAVKDLASIKRDLETVQANLASLMGLHPSTEFKLVGTEYGNFEIPEMRSNLSQLEWLALSNRPELRVHDLISSTEDKELIIRRFHEDNQSKYRDNQRRYNEQWSKQSCQMGMTAMEEAKKANPNALETLRRQRMTSLILNQVYVSWAQYMAATEDYQINMEIANTSENIAEDFTFTEGSTSETSQLEASRAIYDEVKAFLSYVDVQDALGNLYATIGLDALPYYMLGEKPSKIALYLRANSEKWEKEEFLPDNRPYLLNLPSKRPPVKIPSSTTLPDVVVETGQEIFIEVPLSVFDEMGWKGEIKTRAGLIDDSSLPKWLKYSDETHAFTGKAVSGNGGVYKIKVYGVDEKGNIAYAIFKLTVREVFTPSVRLKGLGDGRKATVLQRCVGEHCKDSYIQQSEIGRSVQTSPHF